MPRHPTARPLGEYHQVLSRLLRQMQIDAKVYPPVKRHIADALRLLGEQMVDPNRVPEDDELTEPADGTS